MGIAHERSNNFFQQLFAPMHKTNFRIHSSPESWLHRRQATATERLSVHKPVYRISVRGNHVPEPPEERQKPSTTAMEPLTPGNAVRHRAYIATRPLKKDLAPVGLQPIQDCILSNIDGIACRCWLFCCLQRRARRAMRCGAVL